MESGSVLQKIDSDKKTLETILETKTKQPYSVIVDVALVPLPSERQKDNQNSNDKPKDKPNKDKPAGDKNNDSNKPEAKKPTKEKPGAENPNQENSGEFKPSVAAQVAALRGTNNSKPRVDQEESTPEKTRLSANNDITSPPAGNDKINPQIGNDEITVHDENPNSQKRDPQGKITPAQIKQLRKGEPLFASNKKTPNPQSKSGKNLNPLSTGLNKDKGQTR